MSDQEKDQEREAILKNEQEQDVNENSVNESDTSDLKKSPQDTPDSEKESIKETEQKKQETSVDESDQNENKPGDTTSEKVENQIEASESDEDEEDEITSSDDEETEDDSEQDKGTTDYHSMSQKELVGSLKDLLKTGKIQEIKKEVDEIRHEFNSQFDDEINEKKEEFIAQGGNIIDFHYSSPLKNEFNSLYFEYREKRNNYFKNLKKDLQANLQKRLELIEELKGLIDVEENINTTYKHFKDIQERWREAGPIPRDGYNTVWNNYHHHVENFYDFLHLNREFRDLDFKHNLEQKLKIINRAEELANEENVNKAFRELQLLHKMWKEDTGPVAKEYRDDVWDRFSAATKVIHDKRAEYQKEIEKDFEKNLELKNEITSRIEELTENTKNSHQAWQQGIKALEKLREEFFNAGKVPAKNNDESWNNFKEAVRNFNRKKNQFYKNQKKEQYTNLSKKQELIKIAEENKDSDDFEVVTPLMKKIQNEWKQIGHVPRKDSDKIWKQFKAACNHYFDRFHASRNKASEDEVKNLEAKNTLLEELKAFDLSGEPKSDLKFIKEKISTWKDIGRVPFAKKNIESKFNKTIDALFKKLDVSKKEIELIKYDNKLNNITSQDDERKIQNERFFITKKIDEVKQEINQLENNLGFFQYVDDSNPMVKEVHKNIQRHKDELELWKEKLKKLKEVM
ncbi:DUF349 domain-containing protein [Planktosalinus lacus]|uniref:Chromosome segregation protein n=1 Tax=Planktosalinus lacus TaxID=1526573 RepID=A0A8J2Y977_9FLAO|nr:DUF349 domain-containing protein [Planktosalinus lacus]GGD90872.1 hypothetical protein GCM10011312_13360 [Planktosalinus lacus]